MAARAFQQLRVSASTLTPRLPAAPALAPPSQANIGAAKAVSDIVRTTLGPKAMLKMLLDPMGGIVITNGAQAN